MEVNKVKKANYYLIWSAIAEKMVDMYSEFRGYPIHIPTVQNKLKNIQIDLEKNSRKIHQMFCKDESGQEELNYYRIVNIIDKLIDSAADMDRFSESLGIIEKGLNGEYTMIDETQFKQLIKENHANKSGN
jgi:hypothetical protein